MEMDTSSAFEDFVEEVADNITKDMSVEEVAGWLERKGIPSSFCEIFESNYIDGKEFLDLTDQDIRDMVSAIGIAKKISRLIPKDKTVAGIAQQLNQEPPATVPASHSSFGSPPSASFVGSPSPSHSLVSASSTSTSTRIEIPNHWRPETEACLKKKVLTKESRSDIVRTLVTLTISKFGSKPSRQHCEQFARQLILQYPFLKDDIGKGYTSWVEKMLERIRNLIKCDRKKSKDTSVEESCTPKRSRVKVDTLIRRYPITISRSDSTPDQETIDQHSKAIADEMTKSKPRERILLPLMKTTFATRWLFVTKDAKSVEEILDKYPPLKFPGILEQEICLIADRKDVKMAFGDQWEIFYPAIIAYGQSSSKKTIKSILSSVEILSEQEQQIAAFKVLCEAMAPKNVKDSSKLLYNEYEASVSVSNASTVGTNLLAPRIGTFQQHESKEFFIFVENIVLCKASTFSHALFLMFASYYTFYVEYPTHVKNAMYFLQDYIFNYPDSLNRNASYLAISSDIKRNI